MASKIIIAVDGPSASGKGTVARGVAKELNLAHLDTGLLYRAVGVRSLTETPDFSDLAAIIRIARNFNSEWLADPDLRTEHASSAASKVAVIKEVRIALLEYQRAFAENPPYGEGSILDGRDIGTVICPKAPIKLFITASAEVRAQRRFDELLKTDKSVVFETIYADILARDERDTKRAEAPLKKAEDALLIDTTKMSITAAIAETSQLALKALREKQSSFVCV